jgi:hypothetical protein
MLLAEKELSAFAVILTPKKTRSTTRRAIAVVVNASATRDSQAEGHDGMSKKNKTIELTQEEVNHLYAMIHLQGFREKWEYSPETRRNRTEMQRGDGQDL